MNGVLRLSICYFVLSRNGDQHVISHRDVCTMSAIEEREYRHHSPGRNSVLNELAQNLWSSNLVPRVSLDRETSDPAKFRFEVRKYRTPVKSRMPSFQNNGSTNSLVFYFRLFLLFLKPIKIDYATDLLSPSFRQACTVRNEDSRYENAKTVIIIFRRS